MKRIITACGSGVATSETVACKLRDLIEAAGLKSKATVEAVDIKSIESFLKTADIYVTITPGMGQQFDIPTFNGIPFLTGVGMQEEFDKIVKLINE